MMETITEKKENITFRQYYEGLSNEEKKQIKEKLLPFVTNSHFYACLRNNKFRPLLRKEIELITKIQFNWA